MSRFFDFHNVEIKKQSQGDGVVVSGDVINNTGRNYNSVLFRATLFVKTVPVGSITFTINGFIAGQSRNFEKQVGDLLADGVLKNINRYEIYPENAY